MLMMTMMILIADAYDGGDDADDVDKGCLLVHIRFRVSKTPTKEEVSIWSQSPLLLLL